MGMDGYLSHGISSKNVRKGDPGRDYIFADMPSSSASSSSSSIASLSEQQQRGDMEVKEVESGSIETSSSERRVWLVKMPDFVFDRITELDGDGELDVGAVRIHPAVGDTPVRVTIKLDEDGPCGDIPLEYELRVTKSQQHMHMFSEDEDNRAVSIDGRVEQECQMKPIFNQGYREVLQNRTLEANRPLRTVQMVNAFDSPVGLGLPKYQQERMLIERYNRRVAPELRRERLPQDQVLDMLFRAFERQTHCSLQQLVDATHQPVQYLKETLAEIAIYNMRGPYKNLYELKPEYKAGNSR